MERQNIIKLYLQAFREPGAMLPISIDTDGALEIIRAISWEAVTDLSLCKSGEFPNIFLYEKNEEKKSLSIEDIRIFLERVHEKPYEWRTLSIIRDVDLASTEAMNALLKILEEPPEHSAIILVTEKPESLIDTVRSRVIIAESIYRALPVTTEKKEAIRLYFGGDVTPLISLLYREKMEDEEAISLLMESIQYASWEFLEKIEQAIGEIFHVNESSRNILDTVFLSHVPGRA